MSLQNLQSEMAVLQNKIDKAATSTKRKNVLVLCLSLVSVVMVGFYLSRFYQAARDFTPDVVAANAQQIIRDELPKRTADLEKNLIANAPKYISDGEQQLQQIPDQFAKQLTARTQAEMDRQMPQVEAELEQSLRAALKDAAATGGKGDDFARAKQMVDALADTYHTETIKLVNDVHTTYTKNSGDIVGYLKTLGENKNLNSEQRIHRDMVQKFLVLAHHVQVKSEGTPVLPAVGK